MARIFVEGWSPEYGAPLDAAELAPAEGSVDDTVETEDWRPRDGIDDGCERIAFVDGVRRIDARLTVDDPVAGPVPGICGTVAIGAVLWDRRAVRSEVASEHVQRWAVLAGGREELFPVVDLTPPFETMTIASRDGDALVHALQSRMRAAEASLATSLADDRCVFADGPLNELGPHEVVGVVKSHRVTYLEPARNRVIAALGPGPAHTAVRDQGLREVLLVRAPRLDRRRPRLERARAVRGVGAPAVRNGHDDRRPRGGLLPLVASQAHLDPRAPQNLVPIGALERLLRHRMGDPGLVYRALRAAVSDRRAS